MDIRNNMTDKIYIGIDDKRIEAKGEVLEQILKYQAEYEAQQRLIEAEQTAKAEAKASAMAKLAALGLSDEEIQAIIGA
jgi:regulator of protease activity HflC (stomatin/prohibitin superfamily)